MKAEHNLRWLGMTLRLTRLGLGIKKRHTTASQDWEGEDGRQRKRILGEIFFNFTGVQLLYNALSVSAVQHESAISIQVCPPSEASLPPSPSQSTNQLPVLYSSELPLRVVVHASQCDSLSMHSPLSVQRDFLINFVTKVMAASSSGPAYLNKIRCLSMSAKYSLAQLYWYPTLHNF